MSERFDAPSRKIAQFYQIEQIIDPELHTIHGPIATSFQVNKELAPMLGSRHLMLPE
jgi:hypothetical protein